MVDPVPWRSHAVRGGLVLIGVLGYQVIARGEISPTIAVAVAAGFVAMAELVRRRTA